MNETERTKMTEAIAYIRRILDCEGALAEGLCTEALGLCRDLNFFFDVQEAKERLWCYLEDPAEEYKNLYDTYGSAAYDKAKDETAKDPALLKALAYSYWEHKSPEWSDDEAWHDAFKDEDGFIFERFRRNLYNSRKACLSVLQGELRNLLRNFVSGDYANALAENEEFSKAVLNDLRVCTNMYAGEPYNEDDLRLAVGRVLMKKYGMDC